MNIPLLTFVYGAALHICSLIAVVILMATGHLDQATGYPLLAALIGFGAGVAVTPNITIAATPPAVPVAAVTAMPAPSVSAVPQVPPAA